MRQCLIEYQHQKELMQCLVEYLVVFVSLLAFNRNFEETQAKCIDVQLNEQIEK